MYSANSERVAEKMGELVSNLRLDLEATGTAVARLLPTLTYNRLKMIFEIAEIEKEEMLDDAIKWQQHSLW